MCHKQEALHVQQLSIRRYLVAEQPNFETTPSAAAAAPLTAALFPARCTRYFSDPSATHNHNQNYQLRHNHTSQSHQAAPPHTSEDEIPHCRGSVGTLGCCPPLRAAEGGGATQITSSEVFA